MYVLTHDLKGVEAMADDILIYGVGETTEEALKDHNQKVVSKLNKSKVIFCKKKVKFFGHYLTNEGLKPDNSKVIAVKEMPSPSNKKDLLRLIGMINYLGRYIKNLSANLAFLRELIKENTALSWGENEEAEFRRIKEMMSEVTTRKYFDIRKPITIEYDASSLGLGATAFQDGRVVAYASCELTKAEKNYAQIEKELLAIVFACNRFDQMIVGNSRTIIKIDHKPLLNMYI
ncbi:RNase H-like domain found in reverse transcriptase [Popillia japonica]|uniref:RNA-directed DNA polymerase n=1 Tax=Popillia japonica TaxID=7064 RepID=A0AAW1IXR5_POPJA